MDRMLFNLLKTDAPAATVVIRLLAGGVFFAEGIKKIHVSCRMGDGTI
jgi:uncharacterized membrane protein YphA (DoxX/SURF4 family)